MSEELPPEARAKLALDIEKDAKSTRLAFGCLALVAFLAVVAAFSTLVLLRGWP
jgi:hypothetical protein